MKEIYNRFLNGDTDCLAQIICAYKDGTVVTKMVDISFDDEGYAYIVQRDDVAEDENTWAGL